MFDDNIDRCRTPTLKKWWLGDDYKFNDISINDDYGFFTFKLEPTGRSLMLGFPGLPVGTNLYYLDFYLYTQYGYKLVNHYHAVTDFIPISDRSAYTENKRFLITMFRLKYEKEFEKLWAVTTATYDPIENYNLVEHGEDLTETEDSHHTTGTDLHFDTVKDRGSASRVHSDNGNESTESTNTTSASSVSHKTESGLETGRQSDASKLYGFNSPSAVGDRENGSDFSTSKNGAENNSESTKSDGGTTGYRATNNVGSDTESQSSQNDSVSNGVITDSFAGKGESNLNHDLTRHGNIGVTTSQQMIQSEIDLWKNFAYYKELVRKVAEFLTLKIY